MTERNYIDSLQTKADAASALNVTTRTIDRYIRQGHLAARKLPSGRVLIEADSIARFQQGTPALAGGGDAQ